MTSSEEPPIAADMRTPGDQADLKLNKESGTSAITLRRLQIFWAVAHTDSLTRAAKLLGLSQPSISQQIAAFEASVGTQLFDRTSNTLFLTDSGKMVLRKAEHVLRAMQDLEDVFPRTGDGTTWKIRLAGVASAMRSIVPVALRDLQNSGIPIECDLYESAPAEILEMLYARRIGIGIIASNSVAETGTDFHQVPLLTDPHALVVPRSLDLSMVQDPSNDLDPGQQKILNCTIQFVFGNHHSRRMDEWYDRVLPEHITVARTRSFELAVELVRREVGVCVAPTLGVPPESRILRDVTLYDAGLEERKLVAMLPSHYMHNERYSKLVSALSRAAQAVRLPGTHATPPFMRGL